MHCSCSNLENSLFLTKYKISSIESNSFKWTLWLNPENDGLHFNPESLNILVFRTVGFSSILEKVSLLILENHLIRSTCYKWQFQSNYPKKKKNVSVTSHKYIVQYLQWISLILKIAYCHIWTDRGIPSRLWLASVRNTESRNINISTQVKFTITQLAVHLQLYASVVKLWGVVRG